MPEQEYIEVEPTLSSACIDWSKCQISQLPQTRAVPSLKRNQGASRVIPSSKSYFPYELDGDEVYSKSFQNLTKGRKLTKTQNHCKATKNASTIYMKTISPSAQVIPIATVNPCPKCDVNTKLRRSKYVNRRQKHKHKNKHMNKRYSKQRGSSRILNRATLKTARKKSYLQRRVENYSIYENDEKVQEEEFDSWGWFVDPSEIYI